MVKVHPADPLPPRIEPASPRRGHPIRWVVLGAASVLATMLGLQWMRNTPDEGSRERNETAAGTVTNAQMDTADPPSAATPPELTPPTAAALVLPSTEHDLERESAETETAALPRKPRPRSKRPAGLKPNPY